MDKDDIEFSDDEQSIISGEESEEEEEVEQDQDQGKSEKIYVAKTTQSDDEYDPTEVIDDDDIVDEDDVDVDIEEEEDDEVDGNGDDDPGVLSGKPPTDIMLGKDEDEDDDDDDDDEPDEHYLQKFNDAVTKNYILDFHPECKMHNYDEISAHTIVIRDAYNNIIDDLHRTLPYLTKYEKARVLGQRAKQINMGAKSFVKVPDNVIDGYLIAELELAQKRIPFIIRRPIFGGGCEYWNLKDLEIIGF
jgi:DNA-directed RNA polymerase I, II, and III subunit RPABC2